MIGPLLVDACPDEHPPLVLDLIEELIEHALITVDDYSGTLPRLRMLETIREYATEQLDGHGENAAAGNAHSQYFAEWLEEIVPTLSSAGAGEAVASVRGELGNLRGVLQWLQRNDQPRWWRTTNLMFAYWRIDGPYGEAADELTAVVEAIDDEFSVDQADALSALGWLAGARGSFREADTLFGRALEIYAAADRPEQVTDMHYQLALSAEWTGNYGAARRHQIARRAFHEEQGDENRIARVEHDLGRLASYEGDYATAIELIMSSLAVYRRLGDVHLIAIALYDLATVEMFQGDAEASIAHIGESLVLMRTLDDPYLLASVTATQARVQQLAGDFEAAESTIADAAIRVEELGDANLQSMVLYTRGCNALGLGRYEEARDCFLRDLESALAREDRWRIAEILDRLATIAIATARPELAARLQGRATREREETGGHIPPVNLPECEATTGRARAELGDARYGELLAEGRAMDATELHG